MSMDIYARAGTKVIFAHPQAGYEPEQQLAAKCLQVGKTYIVLKTVIDTYHTDVFLEEVPGISFNSVLFEVS